ncbi:fumarylacetoacetate hydrolase family protein [Photorhabdus heterorhabditis]|uniref:2-keto-4-pentenoate hydratase n=1 Tax=Photorhabdus heterorhabditis TaxID=880156 RepID=A0ABR5KEW3_9GAMM|nr:fumarylacetoacetate hydrolase family protein [Photorhabdus heterorhabditis]KOY63154.1 2-keto-4-pentenoate hydratase [Photorhabdus heterorhabditis]MBS9441674.1 2-oxopent-4-enoate hydratase [Photorhabdus heterorhabditis]
MSNVINHLSETLFQSWRNNQAITPISDNYPELTLHDAYLIQQKFIVRRLETTGERIIGKKIGITSQTVMDLLGVDQPDFGILTSDMYCANNSTVSIKQLIAPKAEGEIGFILKRNLRGPGITIADVLQATDYVVPCIEIVDSRIRDWKIKITDTVADNASSGLFIIGNGTRLPSEIDLAAITMTLEKNGKLIDTGIGAAALGHPANAVAWLANMLGTLDMSLLRGEIILSGSLATMVPINEGDRLKINLLGLGSAGVNFV